ncbi:acyltransferase [Tunturiibacter lichenicola]|jgi:acetyltransferase-like isoleucine patch superfamily enzyme|uniref:acyltransferase n=1 Tax=Tunturiibacter lichenicola TaxID=2051959 RepID=UPI003D9ADC65
MNFVNPMPRGQKRTLVRRLLSFARGPIPEKFNTLKRVFYYFKGILYYRQVFGSFGINSILFKPLLLSNPRFIHIGKNVDIGQGVRMEALITSGKRIPEFRIGDNVNIEQNVHLVCHSRLVIGSDVSITGHCAIVDVTHPYANVDDPIKIGSRILDEDSFVEIGNGSFLGFGTVVMPNVRIGKNCIIGAHSVVTKNVPDYSVIAGNPAKVLRRYDHIAGEWLAQR